MATKRTGSRLLHDFEVKRLLGAGSFGTVLECRNRLDKKSYAIKIEFDGVENARKEIENLVKVPNHENLVQYFTCWEDKFSRSETENYKAMLGKISIPYDKICICIQMELCGQDLRHWLGNQKTVNDEKAVQIFIQLAQGIEHLHNHGLIHRDLKPENIFLGAKEPLTVKVGDLGIAVGHNSATRSALHSRGVGTPMYFAPEQEGSRYGKAVDIFAMGIILMELLCPTLQPKANGGSFDYLINKIKELKFKQKLPSSVAAKYPLASKLILKMTSYAASDRPDFARIYGTFAAPSTSNGGTRTRNLTQAAEAVKTAMTAARGPSATTENYTATAEYKTTTPLPVHHGTNCDGCGMKNIRGVRYKCSVCTNYDLCEHCEQRPGIHAADHTLFKIKVPTATGGNLAAAFGNMALNAQLVHPPNPFMHNPPPRKNFHKAPAPQLHPMYGQQRQPHPLYGQQPAPHPLYGHQPAPHQLYGHQPAPHPLYGHQPAPHPLYGQQPPPTVYPETNRYYDDYDDDSTDDDDDLFDPDQPVRRNRDYGYVNGAICNECDRHLRRWYHCEDCHNYEFDLCSNCYSSSDLYRHTRDHEFKRYQAER